MIWSDALLRAQALLHAYGITAWQDAIVGGNPVTVDASGAYTRAVRDGRLTARVTATLWWDGTRGAEQLPDLLTAREKLTHGRLRATSVKIMQDGIAENRTAAMLGPYLDGRGRASGDSGISFSRCGRSTSRRWTSSPSRT